MKRTEIENAINNYRITCMNNTADKGRFGKVLEVLTRDYILCHGIERLEDCKARKLGSDDIRTRRDGAIEVKSGAGAVCYGSNFTKDDLIADNVVADANIVVWYPWPKVALTQSNPLKFGWAFSRNEFINALDRMGRNGLASMVHVTMHGTQINLQALSSKHEAILYDILEGLPTVWEKWNN